MELSSGDDFLIGDERDNSLQGYPGLREFGEGGEDETGDDRIYGRGGDDGIVAGGGDDTVYGDAGDDRLFGITGDDRLLGGDGRDVLSGYEGRDLLVGGADRDEIAGGAGDDRVFGGDGDDRLFGGADVGGESRPPSAEFARRFIGGRDHLFGGLGDDYLFGGLGNDILHGGAGDDWLRGGQGGDRFVFRGQWGDDRLADFQPGRDRLDFGGQGLAFADLEFAAVDLRGDGSADDLLLTVAGVGTIRLFDTAAGDIGAANTIF